MFVIAFAAAALLAGTEATATPAPDAAQPAAAADKPQPKTRRVCYVDEAATGSRMSHKVCHTEVVKDEAKASEAPQTQQK